MSTPESNVDTLNCIEEGYVLSEVDDKEAISQSRSYFGKNDFQTLGPTLTQRAMISKAPDGGAVAWLVVVGAWCTSFCSFGWINSVGTFQAYYELYLLEQYSPSQISWIPSLQIFFMLFMGPVVGKLHDSYGPRYLILAGTFLHVFGLLMASISTTYYQLLLSQGLCSAIGVSAVFQPALSTVNGWFDKKIGIAYGTVATGSSFGGILFPIIVSRLIREVGYGWAMRIAAFIILFLLIIANVTVKSRFPAEAQNLTKTELLRPFQELKMLAIIAGNFLFTFGVFVPITFIVVDATENGMSTELAGYLLAILNAASLLGRLSSGLLADRIGRYNVFIVVCYITGILTLAIWIPAASNTALILYSIFFGFFSGAYVSLGPALVAQISSTAEIGYRTGIFFFVSSFGGLTTGPIAGAITAHSGGNYLGMKIYSGIFCLAGTTLVLAARLYETGPKLAARF